MKKKIGIFFGSDTGNTEKISYLIKDHLNTFDVKIYDIAKSTKDDIEKYEFLILGIPTWYYGEPQCDWEDFFPILKKVNFSKKTIAIFGCGDQEDYSEYFCDAIGIIHNILSKKNAKIIGYWPNQGYLFDSSKALSNNNYFYGLPIDEDRQPEMTKKRVSDWIKKIIQDIL